MKYRVGSGRTHKLTIRDASTVFVIDELGEPLADADVQIRMEDGRSLDLKTDDKGRLKRVLAEGTIRNISVDDCHEVGTGDGIENESGQHFTR